MRRLRHFTLDLEGSPEELRRVLDAATREMERIMFERDRELHEDLSLRGPYSLRTHFPFKGTLTLREDI